MLRFRYNSYHKTVTVVLVIAWAIFHFAGAGDDDKYYENGQQKRSGSFLNGKNHGRWIWYYENGQRKMEGEFLHGKRTGQWIIRDRQGNKITQSEYQNDKLNGEFIRWNTEGKILEKLVYEDDKIIKRYRVTQPE